MPETNTSNNEFDKYKHLALKILHMVKHPLSLHDELLSIGHLTILEILNKYKSPNSDMRMDIYIIYILKHTYIRALLKNYSYWPWSKDQPQMVSYDESEFRYSFGSEPLHDNVCHDELSKDLDRAFSTITERQSKLLKLRYGVGHDREHTGTEIASMLGCSHQAVFITGKRGLNNLKNRCPWLKNHLCMEDAEC